MPGINVTRSLMPSFEEYSDEIKDLWESRFLTNMGEKHKKLAEEFSRRTGVSDVILTCNGHTALELLLEAFDLSGEVITTPFTFVSTTHAIVRKGLTPVFCDIRPDDFTLDASKIESLITERTSAIVPVHVYGNVCDVEEIEKIARRHGLKVIYDAAHAFGVRYKGKDVASYGDASMISFHATKVFHTIEGGAICLRDRDMAKKLSLLINFGIRDQENTEYAGANGKMNEFEAAMGICNLRHIDEEIEKRGAIDRRYRENLAEADGLFMPHKREGAVSNYAYFPLVVFEDEFGATRDDIIKALADENIFARKYFYPLTSAAKCYEGRFDPLKTPVAFEISKRVLTLPIYGELTAEDVDRICGILLSTGKKA